MSILSKPGNAVGHALSSAEKVTFATAMGLPDAVIRRLAGRPVELDGQRLAADIQLMLKLVKVAGPPIESLPIEKGRVALVRQSVVAGGEQRVGKVQTVRAAGCQARLYTPTFIDASAPGPLLVFFHSGGFLYGDLDSHDAAVRFLCEQSGVRVLSVDYRIAPESPFPAAYDDALASFDWAVDHAAALGVDATRIGVGGDSAGGNLAAGVALARGSRCAFQLLIYPATARGDATTASRELFGSGFFLSSGFIELAVRHYVTQDADPDDPRLTLLGAEVPAETAPAFLATAGFDPLRDEGEAYAQKLADAGVEVESWRYSDQVHGFLNMLVARSSRAAAAELAAALERLASASASAA